MENQRVVVVAAPEDWGRVNRSSRQRSAVVGVLLRLLEQDQAHPLEATEVRRILPESVESALAWHLE
jgi:hypothetical protein